MRLRVLKLLSVAAALILAATLVFGPSHAQGPPDGPPMFKKAFKGKGGFAKKKMTRMKKKGGERNACPMWMKRVGANC